MSLVSLLKPQFNAETVHGGEEYFSQNKVVLRNQFSDREVQLWVHGSHKYSVQLTLRGNGPRVDFLCQCPQFQKNGTCKHIWAGVLYADKNSLFPKIAEPVGTPAGGASSQLWLEQFKRSEGRIETAKKNQGQAPKSKEKIQLSYIIDLPRTMETGSIVIRLGIGDIRKDNSVGTIRQATLNSNADYEFPDAVDAKIYDLLTGPSDLIWSDPYFAARGAGMQGFKVPQEQAATWLSMIGGTGRLYLQKSFARQPYTSADLNGIVPYKFDTQYWSLVFTVDDNEETYKVRGRLQSDRGIQKPRDLMGFCGSFGFFNGFVAECQSFDPIWFDWIEKSLEHEIPKAGIGHFLDFFFASPNSPELELPPGLEFEEVSGVKPRPRLTIKASKRRLHLDASLDFVYDNVVVGAQHTRKFLVDGTKHQKIWRDFELEKTVIHEFLHLIDTHEENAIPLIHTPSLIQIPDDQLNQVSQKAQSLGWEVFFKSMKVRAAKEFKMSIQSGMDWFDLKAEAQFDGVNINVSTLIEALESGENMIKMSDGSIGMIPEAWLKKLRFLSRSGELNADGTVRLNRIQALLMAATLENSEALSFDKKFGTIKELLEELKDLPPAKLGKEFKGDLRPYQKEGLSWLQVMSKHQLGAILADDMGLGKTIQILAMLASHYKANPKAGPSLIVAPKSLIFNWMAEAAKFTPQLKTLNLTGPKRHLSLNSIDQVQIVLTTYQSLRSDISKLNTTQFEYFILDEAHFVKNPDAQASMACRLVKSERRLSLTGTPVENSLLDLFSILNIVNPGLMTDEQSNRWLQERSREDLAQLGMALRPFILRRTKEQVLKDLPEKTEQILYCELSPLEEKKYKELKDFYWSRLSDEFASKGLQKSKIKILEALLRLRQAACHQGLLDSTLQTTASSKFELLLEQAETVIEDGHKALVFSQFTSLLKLLGKELEAKGIEYEYLDGQTKDRQERVERFQKDPKVKLFLLSLKAGGVGLNLAAADYVYILDPWWNPAAESQAIDRAHRIGQTNKVFAYRVIAKNTIEEKILELQKSKRDLAKAIVSGDSGLLKNLKIEDLQALFS